MACPEYSRLKEKMNWPYLTVPISDTTLSKKEACTGSIFSTVNYNTSYIYGGLYNPFVGALHRPP